MRFQNIKAILEISKSRYIVNQAYVRLFYLKYLLIIILEESTDQLFQVSIIPE